MEKDPLRLPEFRLPSLEGGESKTSKKENAKKSKLLTPEKNFEPTQPDKAERESARSVLAPSKVWENLIGKTVEADDALPTPKLENILSENTKDDTDNAAEEDNEASETLPLDHLSEQEMNQIALGYIDEHLPEIDTELTAAPDNTEAAAARKFLETIKEQAEADDALPFDTAAQKAYYDTLQTYAPEAIESSETPQEAASPGAEAVAPLDMPPYEFMHADEGNHDPADTSVPPTPPTMPPTLGTRYGGEGGEPPQRPSHTFRFDSRDHTIPLTAPTWSPRAGGAVRAEAANAPGLERQALGRGLLVGGIVGYLIGRRRGRIKTEKRLAVVQKKLEQEVRTIHTQLAQKETQIRTLVHEHATAPTPNQRPAVHEISAPVSARQEAITPEIPLQLPAKQPERLGSVTLKALETKAVENPKPPVSTIEAIDRKDILEASEKIVVGGTTLRQVFETKLISERGLRRAVGEFSRGGDVNRVLAEELLIKELGYERDPRMRDRQLKTASYAGTTAKDSAAIQNQAETSYSSSPATPPNDSAPSAPPPKSTNPPALIVANIVALIVLAILLIILFATHL